jgi:hypothetical protein
MPAVIAMAATLAALIVRVNCLAYEKKMNVGHAMHCIGTTAKPIVSEYGVAWPE